MRTKEDKERFDMEYIKKKVLGNKRKYWYRMITMCLEKEWRKINHKKVYRIMRKYNLLAKIRRRNPYKQIQKATKEHMTKKNILNRNFKWIEPLKKLWTDITYIRFEWKWMYLSVLKDMITWEIISSKISNNIWLEFVNKTIDKLKRKYSKERLKWTIIHSDQWFHYTHPIYCKKIKKLWCIQSMSRKWNCIDNSPTESFFGHLKDEIDITWCKSFNEVEKYIKNYIYYYNNKRPQWKRKKMTPVEYRDHLLSLI